MSGHTMLFHEKEECMTLNQVLYILAIVFGVIIIVAPKIATYLMGAYLITFGVIKLIIALS